MSQILIIVILSNLGGLVNTKFLGKILLVLYVWKLLRHLATIRNPDKEHKLLVAVLLRDIVEYVSWLIGWQSILECLPE